MKILVIGKGFIGERLGLFLSKAPNFEVHTLNRDILDYTNSDLYRMFLSYHKDTINQPFDKVIICTGYMGKTIDDCEIRENRPLTYTMNVIVPDNIINMSREFGATCIYIGTNEIYDGDEKQFTETDVPNFGLYDDRSNFYCKTKHLAELIFSHKCHIFRIGTPFTFVSSSKNLFDKLIESNPTVDKNYCVTSVDDFYNFVYNFILQDFNTPYPFGVYNVTNTQTINTKRIVKLMKKEGIKAAIDKNWDFIHESECFKTLATESNSSLDTSLIHSLNLQLPDTEESIINSLKFYKQFTDNGGVVELNNTVTSQVSEGDTSQVQSISS